jgi:putative ABC transport system permease protein
MTQFLLEAVLLTLTGGGIGIFLGALLAWLVAFGFRQFGGLQWDFVFPISAAILGLVVAGSIGLAFGLYPARQASQKSPIEALRYE